MSVGAITDNTMPMNYSGIDNKSNNVDDTVDAVKEKEPRAWDKCHDKILGLMTIPVSSHESIGVCAFYSNYSTDEDPIITVDVGPNEKYDIHVKEVDPSNANQFEMFALSCYLDDKGITERGSFGSFNRMRSASMCAPGYMDMTDPNQVGKNINWVEMLKEATDVYFGNSETYAQGVESKKLMEKLEEWKKKVVDKILNGETEEKIQTGAGTYTETEWNEMIEEFDEAQEDLREVMREEIAERVEEIVEQSNEQEQKADTGAITKLQEVQLTNSTQIGTTQANGVTECASVTEDESKEKVWTITAFTEQGIVSNKCQNGNIIEHWEYIYNNADDAKRVEDFLNMFDKDAELVFAGSKDFWMEFLSENTDGNGLFADHAAVFDSAAPDAPPIVRVAWINAAKETGYLEGEKMNHISQLFIRQVTNRENGVEDYQNVFGSTVESALQAARELLHDLENPLTSDGNRSESARVSREQEKEFYKKFIEGLEEIAGILVGDENNMHIDEKKAKKYSSKLRPVGEM